MISDWLDKLLAGPSATDLCAHGQDAAWAARHERITVDGDRLAGSDNELIEMIQAQIRSRRHR